MIEKIICDYLNQELNVPAYMEEQKNKPKSYVLIEKTGSGRSNHILSATVAIQSYDGSLYEAASLNETVKEAMLNIINLDEVSSCKINSDYNFTDPETKRYRYQAVFELVHY